MSPRPDVSAQRIPQILEAALVVFARRGVNGATVEEIAQTAGFSKALVFKYFASKEELLLAFVRYFFSTLHVRLEEMDQSEAPFETVIRHWAGELAGAIEEPGVLAVAQELLAAATRNPDMGSVVAQAYVLYRQTIAGLIRRGMARGEVRDVDADAIAMTIIAMIEGFNLLRLVETGTDLATAYRTGIESVLAGILIQPARD